MKTDDLFKFDPANFDPSLVEVVKASGLDGRKLTAMCPESSRLHAGATLPRERVLLHDGAKAAHWMAPPLRTLPRGNQVPPSDIDHYPPEYAPLFFFVEKHVLTLCDAYGDKTDAEFEEWYSNLRRRPDGRSLGECHDQIWRVLALLLAMRPISQAEYEAIVGQLARSAGHFRMGPASRNYMDYLRKTFR